MRLQDLFFCLSACAKRGQPRLRNGIGAVYLSSFRLFPAARKERDHGCFGDLPDPSDPKAFDCAGLEQFIGAVPADHQDLAELPDG